MPNSPSDIKPARAGSNAYCEFGYVLTAWLLSLLALRGELLVWGGLALKGTCYSIVRGLSLLAIDFKDWCGTFVRLFEVLS